MKRRQLLKLGLMSTGMAGVPALANNPTRPSRPTRPIAIDLFDSLTNELMDAFVVDYDDPLRQYHNRGVWAGGKGLAKVDLSETQRS